MNVANNTNIPPSEYFLQVKELVATNYFGLASFVVLLYDHLLTFDDEVRFIWRGKKTLVAWLFLLNRYVTPLGFSVNINAYTSPVWTPLMCVLENVDLMISVDVCFTLRCQHFVRFEGSMTLIGISIASLIMGVRVTAIYRGNRIVPVVLAFLFLSMVGVNAWLLTSGEPVHHPTKIHGCSMIFGPKIGIWSSASAWLPLLYDTVVVVLVTARTRDLSRVRIVGQYRVVETLRKDGLMYYSVILSANLVLAIMIVRSSDGVKNICAQFQLLITVTMMSRITLNLRKNMHLEATESYSPDVWVTYETGRQARNIRTRSRNPSESLMPLRGGHRSASSRDLEAYVLDISSEHGDPRYPERRSELAEED